MRNTMGILALLGLAALAGCATPAVMADHYIVGGRSVAVLMQRAGTLPSEMQSQLPADSGGEDLFHVIVRLCDVKAAAETGCDSTLVLPNVFPQSIY